MQDKKIEFVLIARIDGRQVFHERYADTFEVQEVGLDAAESTVSTYLDTGDLEPEEVSYIHMRENKKINKKFREGKQAKHE
jgi:hypothetical protein